MNKNLKRGSSRFGSDLNGAMESHGLADESTATRKRTIEEAEVEINHLTAENTKKDARIVELMTINQTLSSKNHLMDIATTPNSVYEIGKLAGAGVSGQARQEISEDRVSRNSGFLFRDLRKFTFEGFLSAEYDTCKIVIDFLRGVMDGSRPSAAAACVDDD